VLMIRCCIRVAGGRGQRGCSPSGDSSTGTGTGTGSATSNRSIRELRRVAVLTHAPVPAVVAILLSEGRHFVCEIKLGECASARRVPDDAVGVEVAVKLVFFGFSSDAEEEKSEND